MSYRRLEDPDLPPIQPRTYPDASVYATNTIPAQSGENNTMSYAGSRRGSIFKAILSYAPDWILCIGLSAAFFALDKVPGFKRQFSLTDTSLLHTFAVHERVPPWLLYVIFAVAPIVLMPIINVLLLRSLWDWHSSWLGWLLSCSITGAITQFTKITVGRPRPDVIDRCQPIAGAADPHLVSFAGLGFLAFYLAGKMHLFDERGHTVKAWIALVPLSGAALVAISRTMDYRHHWQDVLTGSLLGLVTAYFSYRQYYPPLNSPLSHLPYPPRYKRGGHEHPAHRSSPSEAQALNNDGRFENIAMRPRMPGMPEQRYADRPSIGDEEMGHPPMAPSGSGSSQDGVVGKDGWHQS
ncbi:hypothetical protein GSI_13795 [Ganoderma sinense ZZ0214-1]|uniref:Phosphatidic acid phosphatase type 2/haloperoxidase domain-containing protein n=1 Tax=Ganoderma sinense ZZ0214-1 TaxID=1077348 RepID=A0A2G8RRA8_9APHY|nr:hypothetical protein GSI_13795 [Ganoderma sinense ZZ0214-1]